MNFNKEVFVRLDASVKSIRGVESYARCISAGLALLLWEL